MSDENPLLKELNYFVENKLISTLWAIGEHRDILTTLTKRLDALEAHTGYVHVSSEPPEPVPGPKYKTPCIIVDDEGFECEVDRAEMRSYTGQEKIWYYWKGSSCVISEGRIARVVRVGPPPEEECTCEARKREEKAGMLYWVDKGEMHIATYTDPCAGGCPGWNIYKTCTHCKLPIKRSLLEGEK